MKKTTKAKSLSGNKMNMNVINNSMLLQMAVEKTKETIEGLAKVKILGVKFNSDGHPIVSVEFEEKTSTNSYATGSYRKHLEFTFKGNSLYPILPLTALCDS